MNPTGRIEAGTERSPPATSYYFWELLLHFLPAKQAGGVCHKQSRKEESYSLVGEGCHISQPNCPFPAPNKKDSRGCVVQHMHTCMEGSESSI